MFSAKIWLRVMVAALGVCALLAVWALVIGDFGDFEARVLGTAFLVAAFSVLALAASVVASRQVWRGVMIGGVVAAAGAVVSYLLMIWFDWDDHWKLALLLTIWAIAIPHAGLLALAKLRAGWVWLLRGGTGLIFLLACTLTLLLIVEPRHPYENLWMRVVGVEAVLAALATLAIPIMHRVQAIEKREQVESIQQQQVQITCPRCLRSQTLPTGHSRCQGCRLIFQIEIEEPRCPRCNYLLHQLTRPVCPECGAKLGSEEVSGGERVESRKETDEGEQAAGG